MYALLILCSQIRKCLSNLANVVHNNIPELQLSQYQNRFPWYHPVNGSALATSIQIHPFGCSLSLKALDFFKCIDILSQK